MYTLIASTGQAAMMARLGYVVLTRKLIKIRNLLASNDMLCPPFFQLSA
jgi:hypothetical protein